MKPKVIILILIIVQLLPLVAFSQTPEENLLKYWYYRDRLKYFVVPGEKQGEGDMAGVRNRMYYLFPDYYNLDFGQNCVYQGYYIGILATEFRILKDNGKDIDALNTEQELVYALKQFYNFLDRCEHWWGDPDLNDGYFIRTAVPFDFNDLFEPAGITSSWNHFFQSERHLNILNHKLNNTDHDWDAISQSFGNPRGHPGYCGDYIGGAVINGSSLGQSGFPEWYSQDEAIGLLMGLALVSTCMPDASIIVEETGKNSQLTAQEFALLIIERICGNDTWKINNPDPNGNPPHHNCISFAYGYAAAGHWFSNGTIPTLHYFTNEYNECMARGWWNNGDAMPAGLTNHVMASTLAALGSSWHSQIFLPPACPIINSNNTEATITNLLENYNLHTFYMLLYKILHPDVTLSNDPFPLSILQLNGAPYEGPYNYGNGIHSGNGWAYTYKWRGNLSEQNDGSTMGNFSGCDYLLFYNLYLLTTSTVAPDYHSYSSYIVENNWPVLEEDGTTILGDEENPLYRTAFTALLSDAEILNSTRFNYQQISIPPIPDHPGNAIFLSENEILLKPGFYCEYGASLQASIVPHIIWETFSNINLLMGEMAPWNNFYLLSDYGETKLFDNEKMTMSYSTNSVKSPSDKKKETIESIAQNIHIFPNPASQKITIQIPEELNLSLGRLQIINNQGVAIYRQNIFNHCVSLDVGFLKPGVYTLSITSIDYTFQSRIVKI